MHVAFNGSVPVKLPEVSFSVAGGASGLDVELWRYVPICCISPASYSNRLLARTTAFGDILTGEQLTE